MQTSKVERSAKPFFLNLYSQDTGTGDTLCMNYQLIRSDNKTQFTIYGVDFPVQVLCKK